MAQVIVRDPDDLPEECSRFVTGVTWVEGELWHGTWEGDGSDSRRIDPKTGEVLDRLELPAGVGVSDSNRMAPISSSAAGAAER